MRPGNAVETAKASRDGDPLRIRDDLPDIIARGSEALTKAEKDLLKWIGVFARVRTPGKFMLRIRMPNGFATSAQLVAIAELSTEFGNCILDLTTRQQVELRGFTLESVPEIFERLRRVDLHTLQTGMDNVRNINGCALAGMTRGELLDASPIVFELDQRLVGSDGNPEFANLPRKLNVTITGCLDNCTHAESQDIALVPAVSGERIGFNVLVGGKMGSGGFTIASPLDVFIGPSGAADVVTELIRIYRDHGPRGARGRCRLAFLVEEWGLPRLRAVLTDRMGRELALAGRDPRSARHTDHLGIERQPGGQLASVGLSVPTGRVTPVDLRELARLADEYGTGNLRLTTAQNVIIPDVPFHRVQRLLYEPLLAKFSPAASPFVRGLVTCIGTDFCNLALIDTKGPALALAKTLETRLGTTGAPLTMHWSGCPAGCGNHQAADIGLRGHRATIDGKVVDAVAIYVRGRTDPMQPRESRFSRRCRVTHCLMSSNAWSSIVGGSLLSISKGLPVMDHLTAAETVAAARQIARQKAALPPAQMLLRGALAGGLLAYATSLVMVILSQGLPPLVGAICFPVGFVMLVLLGLELATGNFALMACALVSGDIGVGRLLRNWTWVYAGNLLGSLAYAALFCAAITSFGASSGGPLADQLRRVAVAKTTTYAALNVAGWATAVVKAVLCNWMVTIGAVLALVSRSTIGKVVAMWLPIATFFAHGYEHSIVNMFVIPAGITLGAPVSFGDSWLWNQIPVTFGNIIGGAVLTGGALAICYPRSASPDASADRQAA